MQIVISGFDSHDPVALDRAKNYVARHYPGEGHTVTQDSVGADVTVTPETLAHEAYLDEWFDADAELSSIPFIDDTEDE